MTDARQHRWTVILAFGLVYLFWGSTYLAIAIGVEHIPPALMCATRFLVAGTLMLGYCWLRGGTVAYIRTAVVAHGSCRHAAADGRQPYPSRSPNRFSPRVSLPC